MSFNRITDLTDVLEGTIVRVITRLDETCREVKNAARLIGDPELFTKMQTAQVSSSLPSKSLQILILCADSRGAGANQTRHYCSRQFVHVER